MIEIKNLIKKYNGNTVLSIDELNIDKGKMYSIIGPNGSGKSTLFKSISNVISTDRGTIILDNKNIKEYSKLEFAKKLSIINQSSDISLDISIEDLVSFGRYPYNQGKLSKIDMSIVSKAIKDIGIEDIKDKYITKLSGGERQRALIAMTLAQQSNYILLDEPLNNLDMRSQYNLMNLLRILINRFNKTVLIILHDISFALNYADKIILLDHGKIVENCIPEDLDATKLGDVYGTPVKITRVDEASSYICDYYYH